MQKTTKSWPSGSQLVMDHVKFKKILAKKFRKKVLSFISTEIYSSTITSKPYED